MSENAMNPDDLEDDLRPEYDFDFSKAVRGKYYAEYMRSTNVVVLEPDVAAAFQNSEAVNAALRSMLAFAKQTQDLTEASALQVKKGSSEKGVGVK
jgi:hypothetical protein